MTWPPPGTGDGSLTRRQRIAAAGRPSYLRVAVDGERATVTVDRRGVERPALAAELRTVLLSIPYTTRTVELAVEDPADLTPAVVAVVVAGANVAESVGASITVVDPPADRLPPGLARLAARPGRAG